MRKRRRPAYFFSVFRAFVDLGLRQLSRSEVAVYLILLRATQPDGLATVSMSSLATRGGMSRRQAIRAVQALVERGVVQVVSRGNRGMRASMYCVLPGGIEAFARGLSSATSSVTPETEVVT
jgi:hypothetical protein